LFFLHYCYKKKILLWLILKQVTLKAFD